MVLRSVWGQDGNVEEWRINSATISADAALSGNFSLELATVDPEEHKTHYSLFIISEKNQSAALCTVCLRIAGQCQTHRKQSEECVKELTPVFADCLQPVSAPHCCRGKPCREMRRPSRVTPAVVFPNLQFTGSSTTPRSPQKAQ